MSDIADGDRGGNGSWGSWLVVREELLVLV